MANNVLTRNKKAGYQKVNLTKIKGYASKKIVNICLISEYAPELLIQGGGTISRLGSFVFW